jgi:uncharacterized protein
MICLYHKGDLDGKCAGAIVREFHADTIMVGVDYEEPLPQIDYSQHRVWLLDFSYPLELMYHLMNISRGLTWIDHHAPIIKDARANGFVNMVEGIQEVGRAGCELTWDYIMRQFSCNEPTPVAVSLLGRYDVFQHTADPRVLPFQYGMRAYRTDPDRPDTEQFWHNLLNCGPNALMISNLVRDGITILRYLDQDNEKYVKRFSHAGEFMGIPAVLLNHPPGGSHIFEHADFPGCPLLVSYGKLPEHEKWLVHLYSFDPTIDCGEIAKRCGGGGHKGAAGFVGTADDLYRLIKVA